MTGRDEQFRRNSSQVNDAEQRLAGQHVFIKRLRASGTRAVDQSPKGRSKRDDWLSLRPNARSEDGLGAAYHMSLYPPTDLVQPDL